MVRRELLKQFKDCLGYRTQQRTQKMQTSLHEMKKRSVLHPIYATYSSFLTPFFLSFVSFPLFLGYVHHLHSSPFSKNLILGEKKKKINSVLVCILTPFCPSCPLAVTNTSSKQDRAAVFHRALVLFWYLVYLTHWLF